MPLRTATRVWLQRAGAALIVIGLVPTLLTIAAFTDELPLRVGETAPRTVVADQRIELLDEDATETARRTAAESVQPVLVVDDEAQAEMVADVRSVFDAAFEVREPVAPSPSSNTSPGEDIQPAPDPSPTEPSEDEQITRLRELVPGLDASALRALIALSDAELRRTETETVEIAQVLARLRITQDQLDETVEEQLRVELALRTFPDTVGEEVVKPLIQTVARPTVVVDPDATSSARQRAADAVEDVTAVWRPGERIVRTGEVVSPVQLEAARQVGLEGSDASETILESLGAMFLVAGAGLIYLRRLQPQVWTSGRKILLVSVLVGFEALAIVGSELLVEVTNPAWWYVAPVGGIAMIAAMMLRPPLGVALILPAVVLVGLTANSPNPIAVFVASQILVAVPLATDIASRADLRRAALRLTMLTPVLALLADALFGARDHLVVAALAGLLNGVVSGLVLQGGMPFLETLFRLPTVTALLDLADRNHPLLRELEQKAPGTYQHSIAVAGLVERACREIGADPLVASVAALYHDIGKVSKPYYFIENQQGIANPHDDLEPIRSAKIIIRHVRDGVEMAESYRLPPEVVSCIGSHHGTMVVTYFYRKALDEVGGDPTKIDQDEYRYDGHKPRSKEAAVLVVADCSEATTRSMAMDRGNLPRDVIERTVDKLIEDRIEDHQFDEADLTFEELRTVRNSIVEALVNIYHPRIAYPGQETPPRPPGPQAGDLPQPAGTPDAAQR